MSSAIMPVAKELLLESDVLSYLPEDTVIIRSEPSSDGTRINYVVSHPDIPDGVVYVTPSFSAHRDENGRVTSIEFTGWNPR
jgi:hypothetical protein